MKKKTILRILCAAIALCMLSVTAFASTALFDEDGLYDDLAEKYKEKDGWTYSMIEACPMTDGSVWMIVYAAPDADGGEEYVNPRNELWHWTPGEEVPETVCNDIINYSYASDEDQLRDITSSYGAPKEDLSHPIGCMFAYDGKLACMNPLTGAVYTVEGKDNVLTFTDICTVKDTSFFFVGEMGSEDYYFNPAISLFVSGGTLVITVNAWDNMGIPDDRLVLVDLKTGAASRADIKGVKTAAPMKDGKLALVVWADQFNQDTSSYNPFTIMSYDVKSGKTKQLFMLDSKNGALAPSYITWSQELDSLVYLDGNKVMATKDGKKIKQVGYTPRDYVQNPAVYGDKLYQRAGSGMYIIDLSSKFAADRFVNVYGFYQSQTSIQFMRDNPDIPIYQSNVYAESTEDLGKLMVSGDDSMDVMVVTTSNGMLDTLIEKGYCMPITPNEEISAYIDDLYPQFRDVVVRDGVIYGIPVRAYSNDGWAVNREVMEDMGLTLADIPTNLSDLCDFISQWNSNGWIEKYPSYTPVSYWQDFKAEMFYQMFNTYTRWCVANNCQVDFSSDLFRQMMEHLDHMQTKEINRQAINANEDEYGYRTGLFEWGRGNVSSFYVDKNFIDVPMGLTKEASIGAGATVEVMVINPKSHHVDEAMKLLTAYAVTPGADSYGVTLLRSKAVPVENKFYEETQSALQRNLNRMKKQLEEAETPEDRKIAEENIRHQEEYMAEYAVSGKYSISPEQIDRYVNHVVPTMYINRPPFKTTSDVSNEFATLRQRYLDGQISMEQFIKEATNKANMMQLEGQ